MIWTAIISSVSALLGALIGLGGAFLNNQVQFNRQIERDRRALTLGKLEELFELLNRLKRAQSEVFLAVLSKGEIKGKEDDVRLLLGRVEALVEFYAPDLGQDFREIERLYLEEYEISLFPLLQYDSVEKRAPHIRPAADRQFAVKDACTVLQAKVAAVARNNV